MRRRIILFSSGLLSACVGNAIEPKKLMGPCPLSRKNGGKEKRRKQKEKGRGKVAYWESFGVCSTPQARPRGSPSTWKSAFKGEWVPPLGQHHTLCSSSHIAIINFVIMPSNLLSIGFYDVSFVGHNQSKSTFLFIKFLIIRIIITTMITPYLYTINFKSQMKREALF